MATTPKKIKVEVDVSAPEEGTVVPDEVEDSVVEGPIGREEFNALATRLEEIALMIQGLSAGTPGGPQIARGAAGLRPQGGKRSPEEQKLFEERQAAQRLTRKKTLAQRP